MSKARDLANAGTALTTVSATELGYLDGVTSAVQTQINSKIGQSTAINPSIVTTKGDILAATGSGTIIRQGIGTNGHVLTADSAEADGLKWAALPSAIPANATATVAAAESHSNTTYTDLTTAGPAVTLTTGTQALVIITTRVSGSANSDNNYMSFAVSGATTIAASDANAINLGGVAAGVNIRASAASSVTLTAGSNTFTAKYRSVNGNPTTWSNRQIFVINLA
jgi:hypothetical protein